MKWMKFRVKTITEAEDVIISALYDLGFEGAQIEDKVPLTASFSQTPATTVSQSFRRFFGEMGFL